MANIVLVRPTNIIQDIAISYQNIIPPTIRTDILRPEAVCMDLLCAHGNNSRGWHRFHIPNRVPMQAHICILEPRRPTQMH